MNLYHTMSNALAFVPVAVTTPAGLVILMSMLRAVEVLLFAAAFGKSSTLPERKLSSTGLGWLLAKLKFVIAR